MIYQHHQSSLPVLCMSNFGMRMALLKSLDFIESIEPFLPQCTITGACISWPVWLVNVVFTCTDYLWDEISCMTKMLFCKCFAYSTAMVHGIIQLSLNTHCLVTFRIKSTFVMELDKTKAYKNIFFIQQQWCLESSDLAWTCFVFSPLRYRLHLWWNKRHEWFLGQKSFVWK